MTSDIASNLSAVADQLSAKATANPTSKYLHNEAADAHGKAAEACSQALYSQPGTWDPNDPLRAKMQAHYSKAGQHRMAASMIDGDSPQGRANMKTDEAMVKGAHAMLTGSTQDHAVASQAHFEAAQAQPNKGGEVAKAHLKSADAHNKAAIKS